MAKDLEENKEFPTDRVLLWPAVQFTQNFVTGIPFLAREMKGKGVLGRRGSISSLCRIALGRFESEDETTKNSRARQHGDPSGSPHGREKRIYPAINVNRSGTRKEELLIKAEILQRIWLLRKLLYQWTSWKRWSSCWTRSRQQKTMRSSLTPCADKKAFDESRRLCIMRRSENRIKRGRYVRSN